MTPRAFLSRMLDLQATPVQMHTGWRPLPGGRLELGQTGYTIQLCGKVGRPPYRLTDPDGRDLADGFLLQQLKHYAEQLAAERAEFRL